MEFLYYTLSLLTISGSLLGYIYYLDRKAKNGWLF